MWKPGSWDPTTSINCRAGAWERFSTILDCRCASLRSTRTWPRSDRTPDTPDPEPEAELAAQMGGG
jgi:hypothetical protein